MLSKQAERLYALKVHLAMLSERPINHPQWVNAVANAEWRVRAQAEFIIGWGCV